MALDEDEQPHESIFYVSYLRETNDPRTLESVLVRGPWTWLHRERAGFFRSVWSIQRRELLAPGITRLQLVETFTANEHAFMFDVFGLTNQQFLFYYQYLLWLIHCWLEFRRTIIWIAIHKKDHY